MRPGAMSRAMMPSEARPPCIGEASPIPLNPPSLWTLTKALRCCGLSPGAQLIWKTSISRIFTPGSNQVSVIRDLDQVLVGVADIDGLDRADRARAWSRPGHDRHAALREMRHHLGKRRLGDEAQIARARCRSVGDEARDIVGRMQIDLLLPEAQRGAALAEGHHRHAEHPRIEVTGMADIGDGQHEMVETRDLHGLPRNANEARSLPRARPCGQGCL